MDCITECHIYKVLKLYGIIHMTQISPTITVVPLQYPTPPLYIVPFTSINTSTSATTTNSTTVVPLHSAIDTNPYPYHGSSPFIS